MAVVSEVLADGETHASLNNLFLYAGAPDDIPLGNKQAKALAWLRAINKAPALNPLGVLGKLIENYMELPLDPEDATYIYRKNRKEKIEKALAGSGLQYIRGGYVSSGSAAPSRTLETIIRERNLTSINEEFDRALRNVESNPREAISAACNILESVCKIYIEDENLEFPAKLDLQGVWAVVRKDLGFDPSKIEDNDLREILAGMISVVKGVGALRTHASSAHGMGKKAYKIEPRHARLAIHSAHTLVIFIFECWDKKKSNKTTS
ncbi:MAG TPA: abortive infection family protein [Gammaproteobacteria bacterium]|nr:abortive infection family protein [Gammaproteobacteria bacterium]